MRITPILGLVGLVAMTAPARANPFTKEMVVKVAAVPGVATVGPWKPTWCAGVPTPASEANAGAGLIRHQESANWENLQQEADAACGAIQNPAFQEQVGMFMQVWVNQTGATPQQIADLLALAVNGSRWDAARKAACDSFPELDRESSARERALQKVDLAVLGCTSKPWHVSVIGSRPHDGLAHFDRGAELPSQLGGIGRMLACFSPEVKIDLFRVAGWALCRHDLAQLDQRKLDAEIKARGLGDYARIVASQALAYVQLRARGYEAAFQAEIARDADVKAVLLTAAEAGWKTWATDYAANKAAVDAAFAYEDVIAGPRKSAAKGCLAGVRDNLKLAMQGRKASSAPDALAIATSGLGPIFIAHLYACIEVDLPASRGLTYPYAYPELGKVLAWGPPARGPRTAAMVAMSKALGAILADRPNFPLGGGMLALEVTMDSGMRHGAQTMPRVDDSGEVATVKVDGDKVHITFKTVKFKDPELLCTPTRGVSMYRPDGTPVYNQSCKYTGKYVTIDSTPKPFYTFTPFAAGIAPKTFVKYASDGLGEGFPIEVWANKDAKQLLAVAGLPVK
jgi:hypothetical protein